MQLQATVWERKKYLKKSEKETFMAYGMIKSPTKFIKFEREMSITFL